MLNFKSLIMNFKLKNPKGDKESLILFYANLPTGERFVYSTSEKIHPKNSDRSSQRPIKSRSPIDQALRSSVELKLNRYEEYFQTVKFDLLAQELEQNKIFSHNLVKTHPLHHLSKLKQNYQADFGKPEYN